MARRVRSATARSCRGCSRASASGPSSRGSGTPSAWLSVPSAARATDVAARSSRRHPGLRSVAVSPRGSPLISARSTRRMYLPECVSGSSLSTTKCLGTAAPPRRSPTNARRCDCCGPSTAAPASGTINAHGAVPSTGFGTPTTTALRSGERWPRRRSARSAFSTSSVPIRTPPTLITSSERPWNEYRPS